MLMDLVRVARRADIAVISVDNPPVNTITAAVRAGLARGLDEVASLAGLIGADKSLELILGARPVDTDAALRYGFLDAVVDGDLEEGSVEYARALLARGKGPRRTSERSVDPATGSEEIVDRFLAQANE